MGVCETQASFLQGTVGRHQVKHALFITKGLAWRLCPIGGKGGKMAGAKLGVPLVML